MTDHIKIHQNCHSLALEFPPHTQRVLDMAGIMVGISDLLNWHADSYVPEMAAEAQKLREVAAEFQL